MTRCEHEGCRRHAAPYKGRGGVPKYCVEHGKPEWAGRRKVARAMEQRRVGKRVSLIGRLKRAGEHTYMIVRVPSDAEGCETGRYLFDLEGNLTAGCFEAGTVLLTHGGYLRVIGAPGWVQATMPIEGDELDRLERSFIHGKPLGSTPPGWRRAPGVEWLVPDRR